MTPRVNIKVNKI